MTSSRTVRPTDPLYLRNAFELEGLSEIAGARHEKRVLAMYAASGHPEIHDDETPWCAAFVGDCLRRAGLSTTNSLLAKSYLRYGTATQFIGYRVPRGAICIWTRNGGGHVNFCLEDDGTRILCIGGNQENRKGGGVTISWRSKSSGLIGAVIPPVKKVTKPKPVPLPEPKPEPKPEPAPAPAPVPVPQPTPEPTPPVTPEVTVPWWKQPFVWLGSLVTGGMLGGVQMTVDAQFLWGVSALIAIVAAVFVVWVYVFPPRGKFFKGIFKG